MVSEPSETSPFLGARAVAKLRILRAEDGSSAQQTNTPTDARWSGFATAFRRRIKRGHFLSAAVLRSRRRTAQNRRRFLVSVVVVPLLCLIGTSALFLTLHPRVSPNTHELRERAADVETHVPDRAPARMSTSVSSAPDGGPSAKPVLVPCDSATVLENAAGEYVIRKLDNRWNVVKKERGIHGDPLPKAVEYVKRINGITNEKVIQPGKRIILPSRDDLLAVAGAGCAPATP